MVYIQLTCKNPSERSALGTSCIGKVFLPNEASCVPSSDAYV
jgi:hypothetical protein